MMMDTNMQCMACLDTGRFIRNLKFGDFMTMCHCNAGIIVTTQLTTRIVDRLRLWTEYAASGDKNTHMRVCRELDELDDQEKRMSVQWYTDMVTKETEYDSIRLTKSYPNRKSVFTTPCIIGVGQTDEELHQLFMLKLTEWNAAYSPTEGSTVHSYDVCGDYCGCERCEALMSSGRGDLLSFVASIELRQSRLAAVDIIRGTLRTYIVEIHRTEAELDRIVKIDNDRANWLPGHTHNRW